MPGKKITVSDFVREVLEDLSSPTTSTFVTRIPQCKDMISHLEEVLLSDKEDILLLKNAVGELCKASEKQACSRLELSDAFNCMSERIMQREEEPMDVGAAFQKFAIMTKEMSRLQENLHQTLHRTVKTPLNSLLKTELSSISELRKPFDRSLKVYQEKFAEIERHKKRAAKDAGLRRSEVTSGETAEETDRERKHLQLTTTEFLLNVSEVRSKKGVRLLGKMMEYFDAQCGYFREGLHTLEFFGSCIDDLKEKLEKIQKDDDKEKDSLLHIRDTLKSDPAIAKYNLHQPKGKAYVGEEKEGFLNRRLKGKVSIWQERRCKVRQGQLDIFHKDESKTPIRVNLLTCQIKPNLKDRFGFDVMSFTVTYQFQADSDESRDEWMSVLLNAKESALASALKSKDDRKDSSNDDLEKLVSHIRDLPSNNRCCDCGSTDDVTWLSTNNGVIVCIECSGVHREMGVLVSKVQSLTLDNVVSSQLLVAKVMTNEGFNMVMEAECKVRPHQNSPMSERREFIKAKYKDKKFVRVRSSDSGELLGAFEQAINSQDIHSFLQAFAETSVLTLPLPSNAKEETVLHLAIKNGNLHLVDFILENCHGLLDKQTSEGSTALHYCAEDNNVEITKLILKSGANPALENLNGLSPIDVAKGLGHGTCEELLVRALQGDRLSFEEVIIDWPIMGDKSFDKSFDDQNGFQQSSVDSSPVSSKPKRHYAMRKSEPELRFKDRGGSPSKDRESHLPMRPPLPRQSKKPSKL